MQIGAAETQKFGTVSGIHPATTHTFSPFLDCHSHPLSRMILSHHASPLILPLSFFVAGFLCHKAGRIPAIGTRIIVFREMEDSVRLEHTAAPDLARIPCTEAGQMHESSHLSPCTLITERVDPSTLYL